MFFRFPPDARWNPERAAVEFSIGVGEYEGIVRIPRRVFQGLLAGRSANAPQGASLLDESPTPERCVEAYHLHRTRLELIAERKVRRRQLTGDGNLEITGRDLRERTPPIGQGLCSSGPGLILVDVLSDGWQADNQRPSRRWSGLFVPAVLAAAEVQPGRACSTDRLVRDKRQTSRAAHGGHARPDDEQT